MSAGCEGVKRVSITLRITPAVAFNYRIFPSRNCVANTLSAILKSYVVAGTAIILQ